MGDNVRRGFLARIKKELRPAFMYVRVWVLRKLWGMHIGKDCMISFSAKLDTTYPRGVHIGDHTAISFGAVILTHDYVRGMHRDTVIGRECQIGARSFIFPGVTIGDNCIVAAASVVMRDVPANSIVSGNPARVIEKDIKTGRWGKLILEESGPATASGADS